MGVKKAKGAAGPLTVIHTQDPNITHPLRQKEVLEKTEMLHGQRFTSYTFQAVVWKHDLKENSQYCWKATEGVLTKYSNDILTFLKRLTQADIAVALSDYLQHQRVKRRTRKREASNK